MQQQLIFIFFLLLVLYLQLFYKKNEVQVTEKFASWLLELLLVNFAGTLMRHLSPTNQSGINFLDLSVSTYLPLKKSQFIILISTKIKRNWLLFHKSLWTLFYLLSHPNFLFEQNKPASLQVLVNDNLTKQWLFVLWRS